MDGKLNIPPIDPEAAKVELPAVLQYSRRVHADRPSIVPAVIKLIQAMVYALMAFIMLPTALLNLGHRNLIELLLISVPLFCICLLMVIGSVCMSILMATEAVCTLRGTSPKGRLRMILNTVSESIR